MYCQKCGSENQTSVKFCRNCGEKISQILSEGREKHDMVNTNTVKPPEDLNTKDSAKYNNLKKKLWYAAGVLLTFVVFEVTTNTDLMGGPKNTFHEAATISTTQQDSNNLPADAVKFIDDFGGQYLDPTSTYYAEMAYEKENNGLGSVISDADSSKITTDRIIGETSELGFTEYKLPTNTKMDRETSLKIFNEYTVKTLNRYMNLLARNPSRDTRALIDKQLQNYCSDALRDDVPGDAFLIDNPKINSLMEMARDVVYKYGSNANYSLTAATSMTSNPESYFNSQSTSFSNTVTNTGSVEWKGQKIEEIQEDGVRIVINVDVYNGNKVTQKKEVIDNVQLFDIRQPEIFGGIAGAPTYSLISIGKQ